MVRISVRISEEEIVKYLKAEQRKKNEKMVLAIHPLWQQKYNFFVGWDIRFMLRKTSGRQRILNRSHGLIFVKKQIKTTRNIQYTQGTIPNITHVFNPVNTVKYNCYICEEYRRSKASNKVVQGKEVCQQNGNPATDLFFTSIAMVVWIRCCLPSSKPESRSVTPILQHITPELNFPYFQS